MATRSKAKSVIVFQSPLATTQCAVLLQNVPMIYPNLSAKISANQDTYQFRVSNRHKNLITTIHILTIGRLEPLPNAGTRVVITDTRIGPSGYVPLYLLAFGGPLLVIAVVMLGKVWLLWGIPLLVILAVILGTITRYAEQQTIQAIRNTLKPGKA